jgi:hypothetical protein
VGRRLAYSVRKHASVLFYTDIIEVQRLNHISLDCFIDQCTRRRALQDVEEANTFAAKVAFTGQQHFQNGVNRSRKSTPAMKRITKECIVQVFCQIISADKLVLANSKSISKKGNPLGLPWPIPQQVLTCRLI